jgi:hypothetical protein
MRLLNLVVQRASPEEHTDFLGDIHASKCGLGPPEVLEAGRRQFGIAHRVLDVAVPKVGLQCPRVMSPVGERVATGVPEHVGVGLEPELGPRCPHARPCGQTQPW